MTIDVKSPDFDMRYTTEEDVPFLEKCFAEPEVLHFLPFSEEGDEIENAIKVWMGFSKYNCSITALWKGQPVGIGILYLMPYRKVAHHCLAKVMVPKEFQRRGVGGDLIKNLKHLAKTHFRQEAIQFEIVQGNPIESILEKQGFYPLTRQAMFFKIDDTYFGRIVMECDLTK